MSDAFDLGFPSGQQESKPRVKGVGHECPTHTFLTYKLFLGRGLFLRTVAGLDTAPNVLEHAFGTLGELPRGL